MPVSALVKEYDCGCFRAGLLKEIEKRKAENDTSATERETN